MDTHPPPNFLIEFGRITRTIFFNIGGGGNRPPLPPCPLAGATGDTKYTTMLPFYCNHNQILSKTPSLVKTKKWCNRILSQYHPISSKQLVSIKGHSFCPLTPPHPTPPHPTHPRSKWQRGSVFRRF